MDRLFKYVDSEDSTAALVTSVELLGSGYESIRDSAAARLIEHGDQQIIFSLFVEGDADKRRTAMSAFHRFLKKNPNGLDAWLADEKNAMVQSVQSAG